MLSFFGHVSITDCQSPLENNFIVLFSVVGGGNASERRRRCRNSGSILQWIELTESCRHEI